MIAGNWLTWKGGPRAAWSQNTPLSAPGTEDKISSQDFAGLWTEPSPWGGLCEVQKYHDIWDLIIIEMTDNIAVWNCNVDKIKMLQWCIHSDYKCARQTAYTLVNHSLSRVLRKFDVFKFLKLWDWLAYSGRTRSKISSLAKNQPIAFDDSIQILQKLAWICNFYDPGLYSKWTFFILFFQDMLTNP